MKPPPDAIRRFDPDHRETRPGNTGSKRRGFERYDRRRRRAWLLQCQRCGAVSTGTVTQSGIVVSNGMRIDYGRHTICAASGERCGGDVQAFDIIGDDAA